MAATIWLLAAMREFGTPHWEIPNLYMGFESQTHTENALIDRYSTRFGQAPAEALAWDWPREDGKTCQKGSFAHKTPMTHNVKNASLKNESRAKIESDQILFNNTA